MFINVNDIKIPNILKAQKSVIEILQSFLKNPIHLILKNNRINKDIIIDFINIHIKIKLL